MKNFTLSIKNPANWTITMPWSSTIEFLENSQDKPSHAKLPTMHLDHEQLTMQHAGTTKPRLQ